MSRTKDWVTTFARFPAGPIPVIGRIAVRVADWSKPQSGTAPMFNQETLERLSSAHPAPAFAIYAPAGIWLAWHAWRTGMNATTVVGAYVAGLLIWSLLEYVMHRGSFHHVPTTRLQVAYAYLLHGVHHAYPDDARRWVIPISISIPLAVAFYFLFTLTLGRFALPAFGGFLHGYLTYDLLHYFIHRGRMPTRLGRFLRQYHLAHHYASPDRHYGVSSPLWDVVFRTK